MRVGYDRVVKNREGVSGDGLEGNFWEEGLPTCIQAKLEVSTGEAFATSSGSWFQYGTT